MNISVNTPRLDRKYCLFVLLVMACVCGYSQGWNWAVSSGGSGYDACRVTCTDSLGNVYVGGNFSSSSISVGTINIVNAGSGDSYIVKYNPSGFPIWAQRIGGSGNESIGGICIGLGGKVYVCGSFASNTISVNPWSMGNASPGTDDLYIACFDSFGSCLWLKPYGTTANQRATGIAYSKALTSFYITGYYDSPQMAFGSVTITNTSSSGKQDAFIAQFDNTGQFQWARTTGASDANDVSYGIALDATGNPCFGGIYSPALVTGTTVIGTSTLSSYGSQDMFVAKYNSLGNFQWARGLGSSTGGDFLGGIAVDGANNICVSGYYQNTSLVIGTNTLTNNGTYDAFVAKYSAAGVVQWAQKISGPDTDYGGGVAVDGNNNVYTTGSFAGTVITVGTTTLTNTNPGPTIDVYVIKYDPSGSPQWATQAKGTNDEWGYGITTDNIGNVFVAGTYNVAGPTAFGTTTLTSLGSNDAFLGKIGCVTTSITGVSSICYGSTTTLTAMGATSYSWNTGGTTPVIIVSPTVSTVYTVIGASTASCVSGPASHTLTVLSTSVNAGPDYNLLCNQKQIISAYCIPASPTSVAWTPTTGLVGSTILNPTITPGSVPVQYKVTVNLNNGCVARDSIIITPYAPTPSICIVTVDSANVNNEIYWDKTAYPSLDSMIIYREVTASVFKQIGAVSRKSLSVFVDTVRSIGPANGDPNISTYRYKIQVRDTCGVYSAKSLWHNTVYFTHTGSTFFWVNNYMIEGNINPVQTYSLMVCPNPTVNPTYTLVGTTTGSQNQLNDPNYNVYQANADWRVYADLGYTCTPSYMYIKGNINPLGANAPISKSSSNIQNNRPSIGIKESNFVKTGLKVYPNPVNGKLFVEINSISEDVSVRMFNLLGQEVYNEKASGTKTIDVSNFTKGLYTLSVIRKEGKANYKIVVE